MVTLVGQPATVVAVAVTGGVGASGGVVRVVVLLVMSRMTYGAYVVVLVASMVRMLSLAIGGVRYVGWTWRWWRGCCR